MILKKIKSFNNYYIDRECNVYSFNTKKGKDVGILMHPYIGVHGYRRIDLVKNKKRYRLLLHRVFAEIFIKNKNNYKQVNHKDGNKLNNSIDNLEWCSQQQNMSHRVKTLGMMTNEKHPKAKLNNKDVYKIRELLKTKGCAEISRMYNLHISTIADIKHNRNWFNLKPCIVNEEAE